jgi:uncharacterized membrane protein
MTTHDIVLIIAAFAASAVEMVEAATIILAVGLTYSWRPALRGLLAALVALAVITAVLGPALVRYVPLNVLQIAIGSLLLAFGLQWLRKAVQRAAHLRSVRNEDAAFKREVAEVTALRDMAGGESAAFLIAFKGVFLEGLEVAFIVITFGAASGRTDLAAAGAGAAVVVVTIAAAVAHRPLAKVPENTIKLVVGLALVSFGTFWAGEGLGVEWQAEDLMLPVLLAVYLAAALGAIYVLGRGWLKPVKRAPKPAARRPEPRPWWSPTGFAKFWYDFLIGDSPTLAVGTAACLVLGWALASSGSVTGAEIAMPAVAMATLGVSVVWR